jgi:hypothetical protein
MDLEPAALEPTEPAENPRPASELQLLAKLCGNQTCPTVYRSDRGTLVVQGYAVSAERAGFDLPEGELLVEIPVELLTQAAGLVS